MVTCSNCGAGIPDESAFCGQCGAPRPDDIKSDLTAEQGEQAEEVVDVVEVIEPEASPGSDPVPFEDYPPPVPAVEKGKSSNTCLWVALGCLFLILVFLCVVTIVFAFTLSTASGIFNQLF